MKVLVIGNGGREHAIAWKIAQSPEVDTVYCAPGNGGTQYEDKCININKDKIDELKAFALDEEIDLTVVGPEVPLSEGIVDSFKSSGLMIFGPSKAAARLESSKAYSKDFMKKYAVRTAAYEVFEDRLAAEEYLEKCDYPVVIKADGLAAGKGVVICENEKEARSTVEEFMIKDIFKGSGKKIIVEEFLEGIEASILSITDGETVLPFISAKDHKNIFDGDLGPNTGGMGAIAPNPYCTEDVFEDFEKSIMKPTLKGIKAEGLDYTGIIFFGIMITKKGAYLLEYNVRMGDPETQAVLPLMKSDFVELINAALDKKLKDFSLEWEERSSCCIVAASGGYPGAYKTGYDILGTEAVNSKVFAAGASIESGTLKTSGGRVLAVSAAGSSPEEARKAAYDDIKKICFKDIYYRKDIGNRH